MYTYFFIFNNSYSEYDLINLKLYLFRHIISNRKRLLESVIVAMFVAIISLLSTMLLNYCQLKIEIGAFNVVQVRNTLNIIKPNNMHDVSVFLINFNHTNLYC